MTLRHLLLHLDKTEGSAVRADLALALARRFEAKLSALYAVCDPDVPSLASKNRFVFVERAAGKVEASFRIHAAASGVDLDWCSDIGATDVHVSRAVVLRARETDLVVLGRVDPKENDGSVPPALVEDTVLHAGRPVLVVPKAGHFPSFPRRAVVAWNGSREASRALHDALPLLALAEEVTVLALAPATAHDEDVGPAKSDGVIAHLAEHGLAANGDRLLFDPSSVEPADRLMAYLADAGADLLVIGAAGQQVGRSAARRSLTRRILSHLSVPMLLSY